jgi:hypothetical protein
MAKPKSIDKALHYVHRPASPSLTHHRAGERFLLSPQENMIKGSDESAMNFGTEGARAKET